MTAGAHRQEAGGKGGAVARMAARWCRDPGFQRWIEAHSGSGKTPRDGETLRQAEGRARGIVLIACGITSRADLDHDRDALARFDAMIRKPYLAHLEAQRLPDGRRMASCAGGRAGWTPGWRGCSQLELSAICVCSLDHS